MPETLAAERQFREALWCEYWVEAINAGFSPAQATEHASALSQETDQVAGVSGLTPLRPDWYYQSRPRVVWRTITSGLIEPARRASRNAATRTTLATASILARRFRWWNAGEKS